MRPRLDTSFVLAEPSGRVLLVVNRAADGWLALDLTGSEEGRMRGPGLELRILRGGRSFRERVFSLHALLSDPREVGALRVPDRTPATFGFGGDLARLLRRAGRRAERRLLLFRGLTVLDPRMNLAPRGAAAAVATPSLVFETPVEELWDRVHGHAVVGISGDATWPP
jgi:hypothetical protein